MSPRHHSLAEKALCSHITSLTVVGNGVYLRTKYTKLYKVMITNMTFPVVKESITKMVFVVLLHKVMMEKKLVSQPLKPVAKIAG